MRRLWVSIESDLAEVFVVGAVVRVICEHLGLNGEEASSMELCTVEAVTNSIKHAYRGELGGEVRVEVAYAPDRLQLDVHDHGRSMSEERQKQLAAGSGIFNFDPDDLDSLPESGMGLEIIRNAVDFTSYTSEAGDNCLRLVKFLRPRRQNGAPV